MRMFKIAVVLLALAGISLAGCVDRVPAGSAGVKVNLYGDNRGVDPNETLGPGWYYVGMFQQLYQFPTYTQTVMWKGDMSIDFSTSEGMHVNADIGVTYHVELKLVPVLFQKFRKGIDEITNIFVHNMIRDEIVRVGSTSTVEQIYGNGKIKIMDEVQRVIASELAPTGIVVEKVYWIGIPRLPQQVTEALNSKMAAIQQAGQRENEIATAKAEALKIQAKAEGDAAAVRINAEAQATANKILAASITPEFVQYQAVLKWDGNLPTTMIPNGAVPFVGAVH